MEKKQQLAIQDAFRRAAVEIDQSLGRSYWKEFFEKLPGGNKHVSFRNLLLDKQHSTWLKVWRRIFDSLAMATRENRR